VHKTDIKEDILQVWDHAGLDTEMDARQLAKKLGTEVDLSRAGSRSGRQLQHPQVGEKFGREGVLGAISNNIDGISVKSIATKNNVAAKKISAGLVTRIVFSLIGNDSNKPLYFPVMWKPIINYFLGKLFGDKKISKEEYEKGIKGTLINEGTTMKVNKQLILEGFVQHLKDNKGKYLTGAALAGTGALYLGGNLPGAIDGAAASAGYVDGRGGGIIDQAGAAITGAEKGYGDDKYTHLSQRTFPSIYRMASNGSEQLTNLANKYSMNQPDTWIGRSNVLAGKVLNTQLQKADAAIGYKG